MTAMQKIWVSAQLTYLRQHERGRNVLRIHRDHRRLGAWGGRDVFGVPSRTPGSRDVEVRSRLEWLEDRRGGSVACTNCEAEDQRDCDCVYCEGCSRRRSGGDYCGDCEQCSDCCSCLRCGDCGCRASDMCGDCNRCGECGCGCDQATFRGSYNVRHGEASKVFPRYVGVEIECGWESGQDREERALTEVVKRWKGSIQEDGSVSVSSRDREITTSPAQGDALREQVVEICKRLGALGAKVNNTCGLHAHINAKDLTWGQILGVVRAYLHIEPALYLMVPESRRGHYSKPWGTTLHDAEVFDGGTIRDRENRLGAAMYGSLAEYERIKRGPYKHEARYHGLNLNSLLLYGTIEFRLHSGTVDSSKILNWASICSAIVEWGRIRGERSVKALGGSTPWESLEKIVLSVTGNMETVKYMRARRDKFQGKIRKERGLGVAAVDPERAGPHESSEGATRIW